MELKVLNIHGYGGETRGTICRRLELLNVEVVSPQLDYDKHDAQSTLDTLKALYCEEKCNAVVGTSLGGFFALVISSIYECPCITVNPCILPFVYLPRLGFKGSIRAYVRLFGIFADLDKRLITTLVGAKDEIIDTLDTTKAFFGGDNYFIDPNGGHRADTLSELDSFLATATTRLQGLLGGIEDTFAVEL